MIPTLFYFVDDTETSFVENDILKLSIKCERLVLLSTELVSKKQSFPKNVIIIDEYIHWKEFKSGKILLSNLMAIVGIYLSESILEKKLLPLRASLALLCSNIFKATEVKRRLIERNFIPEKHSVFYAFWFYDNIYLAWLKRIGFARSIYSRAHGGDVFEERSSLFGKPLFRNFQLAGFNRIFSVSNIGTSYLQKKYPAFSDKILTAYLGSHLHSTINTNSSEEFVLVTCAKIRDIKRIYLIAEALMHIDFTLTWYHFGDENLEAKNDPTIPIYIANKEKLKRKTNIRCIASGQVSNTEIFNFYANNGVNLFISVSAAEGIPVSMMEAISFGIPVISTDVGACSEIVNSKTGKLIYANPDPLSIANEIIEFKNSASNTLAYRQGVREFWEQNFNEDNNYENFYKLINE